MKYDPPRNQEDRREYDRAWNEEHARQDFEKGEYSPGSGPGYSEEDKKDYDRQWERERGKRDRE